MKIKREVVVFVVVFLVLFSFNVNAGVLGKIASLQGMVNLHTNSEGEWESDPNCITGQDALFVAEGNVLIYCQRFYPNAMDYIEVDVSNELKPFQGAGCSGDYRYVGQHMFECLSEEGVCGNGVVDYGEDCDFEDLDGKLCSDLGYDSGVLACDNDCNFDFSECEIVDGESHYECVGESCVEVAGAGSDECSVDGDCVVEEGICGDGFIGSGEECDDGSVVGGDGCGSSCLLESPVGVDSSRPDLVYDRAEQEVSLEWKHFDSLFDGGLPGGGVVFGSITGMSFLDNGFFEGIFDFFKKLFGARTVGLSVGSDGYVIYREFSGNAEVIAYVDADSCGGSCSYEDDVSNLESGDYSYGVAVVLNNVEGRKSSFVSVSILEDIGQVGIFPSAKQYVYVGDEIDFEVSGGVGEYVWEVEGDCGSVSDGLFVAESIGVCRVRVSDSEGDDDSCEIDVSEYSEESNSAPALNPPIGVGNKLVIHGDDLRVELNGVDYDGNKLTYEMKRLRDEDWRAIGSPAGVEFDDETGVFEWDTSDVEAGNYIFNFSVHDGVFCDDEIVNIFVYAVDSGMCDYQGGSMSSPVGACFEEKPLYCDPVHGVRYNCSDCGCSKSSEFEYVCEANGGCVLPFDCEDNDGDGVYVYDESKCRINEVNSDCDDDDANINPFADELCGDEIDNDCDDNIDEAGCLGTGGGDEN